MREHNIQTALLHLVSHSRLYLSMKNIGHIPQPCMYIQSTVIKWAPKASWMIPVHPDILKVCKIWIFLPPTTAVLLCWCSVFSYFCFLPRLLPVSFLWYCEGEGAGLASRETHLQLISNPSSYFNAPGTSPVCQMVASSSSVVYFVSHLTSAATPWLH